MTSWGELVAAEPEFMAAATARFGAGKHKTLATIRADGAPRISGIEMEVIGGELWLAGMPRARKFADLRREPRFALHSPSVDADQDDPGAWPGDAKVSGIAVEVTGRGELAAWAATYPRPMPPGDFELFRVDLREVVVVHMGEPADHLMIEHWHEGRGLTRTRRD